ncbi:hypothetical protein A2U01_0039758 [Trifolium medium]|uniref:Putative plant transposon protein domain-containing protein n=1 Tax=Trifolium medium TaxID=97028 RepID=A0A392Q2H7_9FABA|nr:hypothetical protein [Trifolium medium]
MAFLGFDPWSIAWWSRACSEEFDAILHELALPDKDWHYNHSGERLRLYPSEMEPITKAWINWFIHNFECCSSESQIIISRCLAIYSILRGEDISVGRLIARSIKATVTVQIVYIGHPFVIRLLCERLGVPTRHRDDIRGPVEPIGRKFFRQAQTAANAAHAAHVGTKCVYVKTL